MTKVTDEELVIAGVREWERCKGRSLADSLVFCYRAMRALEPKPIDRVERRPFRLNEEEEIIPDEAEVLENSGQIAAKGITPKADDPWPGYTLHPLEGANGRMFNDPAMAEMDRRIAALEPKEITPREEKILRENSGRLPIPPKVDEQPADARKWFNTPEMADMDFRLDAALSRIEDMERAVTAHDQRIDALGNRAKVEIQEVHDRIGFVRERMTKYDQRIAALERAIARP